MKRFEDKLKKIKNLAAEGSGSDSDPWDLCEELIGELKYHMAVLHNLREKNDALQEKYNALFLKGFEKKKDNN